MTRLTSDSSLNQYHHVVEMMINMCLPHTHWCTHYTSNYTNPFQTIVLARLIAAAKSSAVFGPTSIPCTQAHCLMYDERLHRMSARPTRYKLE